jgi:1,4-alpha-glucan branching enzyme
VIDVGAAPFEWGRHGYIRPAPEDLIIYELYIEDFVAGGGFLGMIEKLDYIQSLGVNAIEMLPITEFGTTHSWGYNPAFPFAPESTYGTPDDLKRLIDEAHRRGLAVIFDLVLNHLDSASPFYRIWGDDYEANPYFFFDAEKDNWGFPALDQESPAMKRLARDIIEFWLNEYRFDGFRYDATRWVGWSGEKDWGAGWFAYVGKMADSDSYHIAEHIPPDPELMIQTHMDSNWDSEFRWRIREMLTQGRLDGDAFARVVDPARSGYAQATHRMIYLESHDEERVLRDMRLAGYDEEEALRRVKTGHAMLLTSPGLIMLFSGEEWGEATEKVVGLNPLHWENLEQPPYRAIRENLVNLIALRRNHPVLTRGAVEFVTLDDAEGVAVYRRAGEDSEVMVAVNFSRAPRSVEINLHPDRNWWVVAGESVDESLLHGGGLFDLPAGGALVLRGEPGGR